MMFKLSALSPGLLLIALLNAQLLQAQPHRHHQNIGDWSDTQPQRFDRHHHQGHHNGPVYDNRYPGSYGYPEDPQFGPRQGPRFGGDPYGGLQPGGGNFGQPGAGFGRHRPEVGYGPQPGFGSQSRPGYGEGARPFQSRPGRPGGNEQWPEWQNQRPENPNNHLQPRPGQGSNEFPPPTGSGFDQRIQPRPQPGRNTPEFNQRTPDNSNNPLQPRPGQGSNGFQSPTGGQFDQRLQPRPQPARDTPEWNNQRPDNSNNPLQPRPGQTANDQNGFQQPGSGHPGNPIQPRPTDFSNFNSQQPDPKSIEPLATHSQQPDLRHEKDNGFQQPIQPRPAGVQPDDGSTASSTTVEENIASIFNTKNTQPEKTEARNLFDTNPRCSPGWEFMAGHCRQKA